MRYQPRASPCHQDNLCGLWCPITQNGNQDRPHVLHRRAGRFVIIAITKPSGGNVMTRAGRLFAAAICLAMQTGLASAAELKVYSTIGVQAALKELTPVFEKQSGDKLAFTFNTAAALTKRIQAGEHADATILTRQNLETLAKENKASGHITPVASSGISVVVKSGAAKPDISTPEALKATLLKAKSIAYSNPAAGGASGVYDGKLIAGMGIADQQKDKTKHPTAGGNAAQLVANDEA